MEKSNKIIIGIWVVALVMGVGAFIAYTLSEKPDVRNATLTLTYADQGTLGNQDGHVEFIDDDSQYQVKVMLSTDIAVKDFKFLKLNAAGTDEKGNMKFKIEGDLYAMEEFSPEKPFVIGMAFEGIIPDRGISYEDSDGTIRYYTIQMSNKDNTLLLTEFEK